MPKYCFLWQGNSICRCRGMLCAEAVHWFQTKVPCHTWDYTAFPGVHGPSQAIFVERTGIPVPYSFNQAWGNPLPQRTYMPGFKTQGPPYLLYEALKRRQENNAISKKSACLQQHLRIDPNTWLASTRRGKSCYKNIDCSTECAFKPECKSLRYLAQDILRKTHLSTRTLRPVSTCADYKGDEVPLRGTGTLIT